MTTVIEPGEMVLHQLTVTTQRPADVKPGEWVEVRKTEYRQRMRVVSVDGKKIMLEWP
jgi:hypothetical protein